jgi:hypothetical protein
MVAVIKIFKVMATRVIKVKATKVRVTKVRVTKVRVTKARDLVILKEDTAVIHHQDIPTQLRLHKDRHRLKNKLNRTQGRDRFCILT